MVKPNLAHDYSYELSLIQRISESEWESDSESESKKYQSLIPKKIRVWIRVWFSTDNFWILLWFSIKFAFELGTGLLSHYDTAAPFIHCDTKSFKHLKSY